MDGQFQLNRYFEIFLAAILTAIIVLIGFYFSPLYILALIIWFIPVVVISMRKDFNAAIATMAFAIIVLIFLLPTLDVTLFLLQFTGVGLIYAYHFRKKSSFFKTLCFGLIYVALVAFTIIAVSLSAVNFDFGELSVGFEEAANSTIATYEAIGLLEVFEEQGMSKEQIKEDLIDLSDFIAKLVPAFMVIYAMLVAFISLFVARFLLSKMSFSIPERPIFREWQLHWSLVWVVIIALAILLLGDFNDSEALFILGLNIIIICIPIFLISGMSTMSYFYKKWSISTLLKITLFIIILIYLPIALILLLLLGIFDPLFNYRKLGSENKETS